jgi:hypothetical protein
MSPEASYGAGMKMTVRQSEGVSDVWVLLTEGETEGLVKALRTRLEGQAGHSGPGYHLHLEDEEGSELTIAVLDPG